MALEIRTIAVLGAGQMGRGIAQVAAQAGLTVRLADQTLALAEKGKSTIGQTLSKLVEKGKLGKVDAEKALALVIPSEIKDIGDCQFAVEAAPEQLAIKQAVLSAASAVLPAEAILASNTSSISITQLAAMTSRPAQCIGMHFMNPVPLMKLVEIIRGLQTSDETCAATLALSQKLGKTTVVSRDVPGFIVNRLLIPMINEACFVVQEGIASPADVDAGVKLGLNHPMGPLELADLIGLDTCLSIAEILHRELGDSKYRPCPLLKQYVTAGWLGRKSGRGFYSY